MITRLREKFKTSYILRASLLTVIVRFTGKGFSFLFRFLVIHILGDFIVGVYSLSKDLLEGVYNFAILGLNVYFMRFMATRHTQEKRQRYYSYIISILLTVGITLTFFFQLSAPFIARVILHKPEIASPIRIIMLSIIPWVFLHVYIDALRGGSDVVIAGLFDTSLIPILNILLLLLFYKLNLTHYIGIYNIISVISVWITTYLALLYFQKKFNLNVRFSLNKKNKPNDLISFAGKVYIINVINSIATIIYTLIKGRFISLITLGILATNQRLLTILAIPSNAVYNTIVAPLVKAHEKGQSYKMKKLRIKAILLTIALMIPIAIAMLLFKNIILAVLGKNYIKYGYIFIWQMMISFIGIFLIPFEITLNMAKKQNALILYYIIVKLILRTIVALILIPMFNVMGVILTDIIILIISVITVIILVELKYNI